ncbi:hypothetical protein [Salinisphaera sp. T31B1]|uniref:hypothetical protein n=1 Tax=Salinisphaera sp. T31B1 TaxID=727963 RepID=UPI00333FE1E7
MTTVRLTDLDEAGCRFAPVTFGQPFRTGDLPAGQTLRAEYKGERLATQVDIKARNEDGSARHAVITVQAPCEDDAVIALVAEAQPDAARPAEVLRMADVLDTAFDTVFRANAAEGQWRVSARELFTQIQRDGGCEQATIYCRKWLAGPLVSEWIVGAPPTNTKGDRQPHLEVYFAVRAYGPSSVEKVRVDVIAENAWAYVKEPRNLNYVATISIPSASTFQTHQLEHYRQARWHKTMWWGKSSKAPLYAALNPAYIQSTPALPNYQDIRLNPKLANKVRQHCDPLKSCDLSKQMQITGAQSQIGPLPRWSSAYVIDTDYRLYRWMLANSDALGAYNIHYREKDHHIPLSLKKHPCATTLWAARSASCDVAPHNDDRFPLCADKGRCKTPLKADNAHHPAPAYVAYLATGDWYYASEMEFWANWSIFWQNPKYRGYDEGLVHSTQLRGQAWALRSLGDAAYILPDDSSLKSYFNDVISRNLEWYNKRYTDSPDSNRLGAVASWGAVIYKNGSAERTGIATWQQSFFNWTVGNLAEQGFDGADRLLDWTSKFQIGLMTSPDYCWPLASAYQVRLRNTKDSPYYTDFGAVYKNTFPELIGAGCAPDKLNVALADKYGKKKWHYPANTMVGYPKSATGFPANFQIGLAAAAGSKNPGAAEAWRLFISRPVKPDYSWAPQFAIAPR